MAVSWLQQKEVFPIGNDDLTTQGRHGVLWRCLRGTGRRAAVETSLGPHWERRMVVDLHKETRGHVS